MINKIGAASELDRITRMPTMRAALIDQHWLGDRADLIAVDAWGVSV
jgi:hypothetical protein